jgi:hypothetical protein
MRVEAMAKTGYGMKEMGFSQSRRGWIWFFLFLAVMGGAAIAIPIIYNQSQQLTVEQLSAARRLWADNAPPNYDLEYQIRSQSDSPNEQNADERFRVEVRNGHIKSVKKDGVPLPAQEWKAHSIVAIFDLIASNLDTDNASTGRRNYAHAQFDKEDGHPTVYVRRIMGSRQRLQIIVQLTRVDTP